MDLPASEQRECRKCGQTKPVAEFPIHTGNRKPRRWCRLCYRAYNRAWLAAHPEVTQRRHKRYWDRSDPRYEARRQHRQTATHEKRLLRYALMNERKAKGCVDCGEKDPRVLEFDHVFGTKTANVAVMAGHSVMRFLEELNKCEVRCANCHARVTYERAHSAPIQLAETVRSGG